MRVEYPIDNLEYRIFVVNSLGFWICLGTMVEIGYVIEHGNFADNSFGESFFSYSLDNICKIPSKFREYCTSSFDSNEEGNKRELIHYFKIGVDFVLTYLPKKEKMKLIIETRDSVNSCYKEWITDKFKEYVIDNRFDFPEEYIELMLS